jgi:putative transposase
MARTVDDEGKVLDLLVQRRWGEAVAVKLLRKLMKKQGCAPDVPVTGRPRSYAAKRTARQGRGRRRNSRGENSPLPGSPARAQDAAFQIAGIS